MGEIKIKANSAWAELGNKCLILMNIVNLIREETLEGKIIKKNTTKVITRGKENYSKRGQRYIMIITKRKRKLMINCEGKCSSVLKTLKVTGLIVCHAKKLTDKNSIRHDCLFFNPTQLCGHTNFVLG